MSQELDNLKTRLKTIEARLERLCNEAAVLCVHCDGIKDGGLGAFATAREFTKAEIANARRELNWETIL